MELIQLKIVPSLLSGSDHASQISINSETERIHKNMPELRAISLLHIKVITLTLPHCSAITLDTNLIIR